MASGLLSLKWNHHRSTFLHVLANIRQKESYCDVTLACAGKFYSAHKLVLSTCSEYFEEMFERTDCKHPVIVLKDIGADELEALLSYMYDGEVNVLQENLSSLIKAAECLKIKGLAVADHDPSEQPIKDIKSASGSSSSKDGVNRSHSNNSGYHHSSDNSSSNSRQFRNSTSNMAGGLKRPNKVDDSQPTKRRRPAAVDPSSSSSPARRPSDKSKEPSSKSKEGAGDDVTAASGDEATNSSVDGAGAGADDHASSDVPDDARSFAQGLSEETGVKAEPVEIIDSDDMNYEGGGGGASDAEFTEEKFAGGAADGGDANSLWGTGDAADLFSQPSTSFGDGGSNNSGGTTNDNSTAGPGGKGSSSGPVGRRVLAGSATTSPSPLHYALRSAATVAVSGDAASIHLLTTQYLHEQCRQTRKKLGIAQQDQENCNGHSQLEDALVDPKQEQLNDGLAFSYPLSKHASDERYNDDQFISERDPTNTNDPDRKNFLNDPAPDNYTSPPGGVRVGASDVFAVSGGKRRGEGSPSATRTTSHIRHRVASSSSSTSPRLVTATGDRLVRSSSARFSSGTTRAPSTPSGSQPLDAGSCYSPSTLLCCPLCPYRAHRPDTLDAHIKKHSQQKLYPCQLCKKCFAKPCQLEVHARTHTGDRPFACDLCSYKSSQKSNLKFHLLKNHERLSKFLCRFCLCRCDDEEHLRDHLVTKHQA